MNHHELAEHFIHMASCEGKIQTVCIAVIFIADRLSGCFRAASEQHRAELRSVLCSVCVLETLMASDLSAASLQTSWLWHTPPDSEDVHTQSRSLSLRPDKTSPLPRCNTAVGRHCHPKTHTNKLSHVLLKSAACCEFKNLKESPDRYLPPHCPVLHRSCSQ